MFECRYCASIFEKLADGGNCPKCGGPGPKLLKPEVVEVYVKEYVYVPQPFKPSYYTPSHGLNPVQSVYGTFGYKAVTTFIILVIAALAISFFYWLAWRAPALRSTDPSYRLSLPTTQPTATQVKEEDPWKDEVWLTSSEGADLRNRENAVNLAYLDKGGALYSSKHSFTFTANDSWKRAKPLGITELTQSGTSVQIRAGGYLYTLNVFQPFVLSSQPTKVNVVDNQGALWQADLTSLTLSGIEEVILGLPITIAPNPNLSYTY